MNTRTQRTIANIFVQIVAMLMLFVAGLNLAEAKVPGMQKSAVEQVQKDRRLAGMIRSSIAFERKLAGKNLTVTVHNCIVHVAGELDSERDHRLLLTVITVAAGNEVKVTTDKLHLAYAPNSRT